MSALFGFGNTLVTAEDNPALVQLSDEHNEIIDEFNELNRAITSEDVPSKPGKAEKARYDELGAKVESLQVRMLKWENRAKDFIMLPKMSVVPKGEPDIAEQLHVQNHVINFVKTLRSDIQSNRVLLVSNYNRLTGEAKGARNFWYAIWSFRLAWLGLILALAGIILSLLLNANGAATVVQHEQARPATHAVDSANQIPSDTAR